MLKGKENGWNLKLIALLAIQRTETPRSVEKERTRSLYVKSSVSRGDKKATGTERGEVLRKGEVSPTKGHPQHWREKASQGGELPTRPIVQRFKKLS